ncbi:MAG TPA: sigma-70 family RNA polymerase sigma factor [Propionicimonas sp.]
MTLEAIPESPTLARARAGDGAAFDELVGPYRRELQVHCYRILGSFHDAEDALQETLVAAWRAIGTFDGRSLRAWLYRIATNRSLNYLRDAGRRPRTQPLGSFPFAAASRSDDPGWLEPIPDALLADAAPGPEARYDTRESIALSFIASLQSLPTQQRAALILRDVLGFTAAETAEALETTPASVNSALQRARASLPARGPQQISLPHSPEEAAVVQRFVDAFEAGDLDAVVALLTKDARITMPPEPFEFRGPAAIAEFYASQWFWGHGVRLVATRANNQPAFGYYLPDDSAGVYRAAGLLVLSVCPSGIVSITRFGDRGTLDLFGLPGVLP